MRSQGNGSRTALYAVWGLSGLGLFGLAAGPVLAHVGAHDPGVAAGLLHPLTGLDHLAAMLMVGLLAARPGRTGLIAVYGFAVLAAALLGAQLGTQFGSRLGILAAWPQWAAYAGPAALLPLALCGLRRVREAQHLAAWLLGVAGALAGFAHGALPGWDGSASPIALAIGSALPVLAGLALGRALRRWTVEAYAGLGLAALGLYGLAA